MNLHVKRLHPEAKLPTKGHPGDAGIDFYTLDTVMFNPYEQRNVRTGVAIEIPEGHVGLIWDKSSISFQKGLKIMGGVIDAGYRGEIIMSLYNTSTTEQVLEKGHKIAQMIIQKFEECEIKEVDTITDSVRGEGREGSTGNT